MSYYAPIGGIAFRAMDAAPSIIFGALYASLLPILIYRICRKSSSTSLMGAIASFCVERVILFSLRSTVAIRSTHDPESESPGLTEYFQVAFAMGSVYVFSDIIQLLRCVLVNSTYSKDSSPNPNPQTPEQDLEKVEIQSPTGSTTTTEVDDQEDQPRTRFWFRRLTDVILPIFIACVVVAVMGSTIVKAQEKNVSKGAVWNKVRYTGTAMSLFLYLYLLALSCYAKRFIPRADKRALNFLITFAALFSIPHIYRLCVLHYRTPDIRAPIAESFNTPTQKAIFYTIHVAPEWIASAIFASINVRKVFDTGNSGDVLCRDSPKPKEKTKEEQAPASTTKAPSRPLMWTVPWWSSRTSRPKVEAGKKQERGVTYVL